MSNRLQLIREAVAKMAGHSSLEDAYSDRAWLLSEYDALQSRLEGWSKDYSSIAKKLDAAERLVDTWHTRAEAHRTAAEAAEKGAKAAESRLSAYRSELCLAYRHLGATEQVIMEKLDRLGVVERGSRIDDVTPREPPPRDPLPENVTVLISARTLGLDQLNGPGGPRAPIEPDEDGDCKRCGYRWEEEERAGTVRHECPPGFLSE
jgi:hypothetical protein